ncbi:MAG TPA: hypothetical protein VF755_25020 [Catenuloplanes sp.]
MVRGDRPDDEGWTGRPPWVGEATPDWISELGDRETDDGAWPSPGSRSTGRAERYRLSRRADDAFDADDDEFDPDDEFDRPGEFDRDSYSEEPTPRTTSRRATVRPPVGRVAPAAPDRWGRGAVQPWERSEAGYRPDPPHGRSRYENDPPPRGERAAGRRRRDTTPDDSYDDYEQRWSPRERPARGYADDPEPPQGEVWQAPGYERPNRPGGYQATRRANDAQPWLRDDAPTVGAVGRAAAPGRSRSEPYGEPFEGSPRDSDYRPARNGFEPPGRTPNPALDLYLPPGRRSATGDDPAWDDRSTRDDDRTPQAPAPRTAWARDDGSTAAADWTRDDGSTTAADWTRDDGSTDWAPVDRPGPARADDAARGDRSVRYGAPDPADRTLPTPPGSDRYGGPERDGEYDERPLRVVEPSGGRPAGGSPSFRAAPRPGQRRPDAPTTTPRGASTAPPPTTPRVLSTAPPPTTPRVLSTAPPPATPRVLSTAPPPATPRVISTAPPPATPRVISTAPPPAIPRVVPAKPATGPQPAPLRAVPNPPAAPRSPSSAPPAPLRAVPDLPAARAVPATPPLAVSPAAPLRAVPTTADPADDQAAARTGTWPPDPANDRAAAPVGDWAAAPVGAWAATIGPPPPAAPGGVPSRRWEERPAATVSGSAAPPAGALVSPPTSPTGRYEGRSGPGTDPVSAPWSPTPIVASTTVSPPAPPGTEPGRPGWTPREGPAPADPVESTRPSPVGPARSNPVEPPGPTPVEYLKTTPVEQAPVGRVDAPRTSPVEPISASPAGTDQTGPAPDGADRAGDATTSAPPTSAVAAPPPTPDPEAMLRAYRWHLHPETLRELVPDADELVDLHHRLTAKLGTATDNSSRARLLGQRSTVSRVLGNLGNAFADGKLALAHAQATGEAIDVATAMARLAPVLQWRGEYDKADRLLLEADHPKLPGELRAAIHENAGRSCYEQGRYLEACDHFGEAVRMAPPDDLDLVGRLEVALDAIFVRVIRTGWGPYPRGREAIVPPDPPPPATTAAPSDGTGSRARPAAD